MARVPEAELSRIKREVSVAELARARGVKLARHGADLLGLCPFHDDKEPSLVISPAKNLWHCLGACSAGGETAGGSVIDWVMRDRGVSFRHAVELLRSDLPAEAVLEERPADPALPSPVVPEAEDAELLDQVVGFYHETLKESPEALEYLERRGLADAELIERFRLGYANRTLGYRLPDKSCKAGREIRGRLQRLGVLRASGHEHFNGSLVVPVFDRSPEEGGRVVEIYGRKIRSNLRKGTPLHLYLPGPHRGVWNLSSFSATKEVILAESLLDAMTFWSAGFRNVTSSYGVNSFTDEMLEAFRAYGIERVLVAYDRDEAGDRAAEALAARLEAEGFAPYRVLFPRGMDANEYAQKVEPAAKSLDLVLRRAAWMGEGEAPEPPPAPVEVAPSAESSEGVPSPAPSLAAGEGEAVNAPQTEPPPMSPAPLVPVRPSVEVPTEIREQEVVIALGDRRYRVRGLQKNLSYDVLRVNLLASRDGHEGGFHVDTLDLYAARQRTGYVKQAASELGVESRIIQQDLGRVLLKLEELQDEQIRRALEPEEEAPVELTSEERAEALELLRAPRLLERVVEDLTRSGVVGEETNKLTAYLAATSRLLPRPLAVVVQSSSAAGKSALMEAVLSLVPPEERVSYSAMTGQSLFYMGEADLKHKILSVAEEEGAERASYALKLLQSEGELTIASTGKDPQTGRLVTHEYRVEGPVAIFLTTTAIDVDEELLNRCLVLSVEESREQTRAIHRLQRERRTLAGLLAGAEREAILKLHRNAQRLLRPLPVVNPYAPELSFLDTQTRTRRDHEKYLALIDAVALVHQYQREVRRTSHAGGEIEYLEVEPSDVELANRLAHEVLGRSLDELPPQTRRLLELVDELVAEASEREGAAREEVRFSRREVRRATGWRDTQLRVHLARLVALEYLLVHQGSRGRSYVYSLAFDPGEGGSEEGAESGGRAGRYLPGLIDPAALGGPKRGGTTTTSRGAGGKNAPPTRPQRGGVAGSPGEVESPVTSGASGATSRGGPEITSRGGSSNELSYRTAASYHQVARGRG